MEPRRNILISAYGCGPGRGSEPGVGWHWSNQVARFHNVWVLTPESERASIEAFPASELPAGLRFLHVDLPRRIRPSNQDTVVRYALHYHLWQIWAYFYVRRMHRTLRFDAIHHLTLGAHWKPSFLALLPIPFLWGPVGGAERTPRSFARSLPWSARLVEVLRSLVHWVAESDPWLRLTARRSRLALAKTAETGARIQTLGARSVEIFSEAGLPEDELARLECVPVRTGEPVRFLSIGRLLHWKGFELGLRAFAQIHGEFPQATYWIAGDGPERPRLEALCGTLGIAGKVTFLGWRSRPEVQEALASCDVVVHPSLHDSGGWACVEAMAAARPVICLDLGGPGVQVTSQTGFKIPATDPAQALAAMAAAMRDLAGDRALVSRLGTAARARVRAEFSWAGKAQKLADFYRRPGVAASSEQEPGRLACQV